MKYQSITRFNKYIEKLFNNKSTHTTLITTESWTACNDFAILHLETSITSSTWDFQQNSNNSNTPYGAKKIPGASETDSKKTKKSKRQNETDTGTSK